MGVQDAGIGVQIARIFPNALFFNLRYPLRFFSERICQPREQQCVNLEKSSDCVTVPI
jgi:hypothetical protein